MGKGPRYIPPIQFDLLAAFFFLQSWPLCFDDLQRLGIGISGTHILSFSGTGNMSDATPYFIFLNLLGGGYVPCLIFFLFSFPVCTIPLLHTPFITRNNVLYRSE